MAETLEHEAEEAKFTNPVEAGPATDELSTSYEVAETEYTRMDPALDEESKEEIRQRLVAAAEREGKSLDHLIVGPEPDPETTKLLGTQTVHRQNFYRNSIERRP